MRNLNKKLQPAVFNVQWETWETNGYQLYLIADAKPEKQTAISSI